MGIGMSYLELQSTSCSLSEGVITKLSDMPTETEIEGKMGDTKGSSGVEVTTTV